MAVRAGGGDSSVSLFHDHRESVAKIVRWFTLLPTVSIHMAVRAGHPGYGLLVRYVHAAGALQNVVAQMIGVRKTEIAVTFGAKLG